LPRKALVGLAKEVHYPAVGFFHDKHNVCMRERNAASHFGQIRLPIADPRLVYHGSIAGHAPSALSFGSPLFSKT
jgi:hypothetical protein